MVIPWAGENGLSENPAPWGAVPANSLAKMVTIKIVTSTIDMPSATRSTRVARLICPYPTAAASRYAIIATGIHPTPLRIPMSWNTLSTNTAVPAQPVAASIT